MLELEENEFWCINVENADREVVKSVFGKFMFAQSHL